MPFFDAEAIVHRLPPAAAVAAIEVALRAGLDPAAGVPRQSVPLPAGELLFMPAATAGYAGVKLATVAPGNAALGLPRVNAVYVLFDGPTLRPVALFDGAALTALRTPAVSVAAVRAALPARPLRLVVFGAGPQGEGHVAALAAVAELSTVDVITRTPHPGRLTAGTPEAGAALAAADVVVCATTARTPLFDSATLRDDVVVIAVGSHEPDARELDAALLGRATVLVEDPATALRECGDVILAIAEGTLTPADLVPIAKATDRAPVANATDRVPIGSTPGRGPVVFKGSGMAWQDLVIAEAVLNA